MYTADMKTNIIHPDTRLVVALVLFIIGLVGFFLSIGTQSLSSLKGNHCTEEAMVCPDGNSVVRSGPQCAFAPCKTSPTIRGITEDPFEVPFEETPTEPNQKTLPAPAPPETPKKEVMCPQDAKMCPDGSFVGRIAPKCQYAPCPVTEDRVQTGPLSL